jgi:non-specific serine/threonine protein kinase
MAQELAISPSGRLGLDTTEPAPTDAISRRIAAAFEPGAPTGLLHLATVELQTPGLSPSLVFAREIGTTYLTRLCHTVGADSSSTIEPIAPPSEEELRHLALHAPPMKGLEYLNTGVLSNWWTELDAHVREEIARAPGGAAEYLRQRSPLWRLVGRVTFHLAENKRDETHPFAFMATYTSGVSSQGRAQHLPLARALEQYAGAKNRAALLSLLTPINQAGERLEWVKELIDNRGIYQPLAWTPKEAHRVLRDLPALEESGLVVRVPDWWKRTQPSRPRVQVKIGEAAKTKLGADALLDFHVNVAIGDQPLSDAEMRELLSASGPLVRLRGQWVEVDREKLSAALDHWKQVEREAKHGGISFFEGMRLLAGTQLSDDGAEAVSEAVREWSGIAPGDWLDRTLSELRDPSSDGATPSELRATLRPYQQAGVHWLRFMSRLGLGACLADDMGLGKTIQVIALLLHTREQKRTSGANNASLLVVPASLIANWQSELQKFAPTIRAMVAHPSETDLDFTNREALDEVCAANDLVITTYGMLTRIELLRKRNWNLVILDEAQAIKNSGARQTRAAKELQASARVALTGTPIENRLSDLWSLFDFLNPGLLGGAKAFGQFVKRMQREEKANYTPLRKLTAPYILRRLKTDKRIIADLPDKTEMRAFCNLSAEQAAMYQQSVHELHDAIAAAEGIQRRGIVLAYLMRLKQICNHPAHWRGDGNFDPALSGKFQRLSELCTELAERQEKVLVFTQFREITQPLADHLHSIFGRAGLVLHGSTSVPQRRKMVEQFQHDDPSAPPFFVLSLKAGGTGLNLTAANHVIHFDRWWNPAVENQATDRAFRIGQKRNVMVHKFVCRGTVEEKIDELIGGKVALSKDLLDSGEGAEKLLTEMDNTELMRFVSLDINKATES